jgi:hypothetical protein
MSCPPCTPSQLGHTLRACAHGARGWGEGERQGGGEGKKSMEYGVKAFTRGESGPEGYVGREVRSACVLFLWGAGGHHHLSVLRDIRVQGRGIGVKGRGRLEGRARLERVTMPLKREDLEI